MIRPVTVFLFMSAVASAARGADATCPTDASGWRPYRDGLAKTLSAAGGNDVNGVAWKSVATCLGQLSDGSSAKTAAAACLRRVTDFLAIEGVSGDTLGFSVPDADYYAKTEVYTTLPAELSTPAFLSLISTWDKTDGIATYIQGLNTARAAAHTPAIAWLTYQTPLTTPDDAQTPGRLLVVDPEPAKHRTVFAQFGLTPPGSTAFSYHVFVIAVVDTDGGKHEGYFHRFAKTKASDGTLGIGEPTGLTPLDACTSCHKSHGPLVLSPTQFEARFQDAATQIQAIELGFGALTSPYDLGPSRGPGLGTPGDRSATAIAACAAYALNGTAPDKKAAAQQAIVDAMSCSDCHDGSYRGRLNLPLSPEVMEKYFWSGAMPPNSDQLTHVQRESLMTCLQVEYFGAPPDYHGVLFDYLTEPSCP